MISRREEERNEKIIRGLMKLPPNRRCINCNSLGPQYVCTTFWTFVCMACSGVHREFTHRVKSVSMAKFTSQEVEALQNGGNQRAREIHLKTWDYQRQRYPDSSNAAKIRDFIKNVYVEKKYAGVSPLGKPIADSQNHRSCEDVTRRADSYHSYSQSPPYDYQYEERRYGKLPMGLTSKSTSQRGLHAKAASFVFSPGRFSDHIFEDRFANEGSSAPRASDFSVSSGGVSFRSETLSPNLQKEAEFSSPRFHHSKAPSSDTVHHTADLFPEGQHQRATSLGSVKSFDSNSMSTKSFNSSGLSDTVPQNVQSPAAPSIDLFQLPGAPVAQSVDTIKPPLPGNSHQPPHANAYIPADLFTGIVDHQLTKPPDLSVPKNEGWATFDSPASAVKPSTESMMPSGYPQLDDSSVKIEGISQTSANVKSPIYHSNPAPALSIPSPWNDESVCTISPWTALVQSVKDVPLATTQLLVEPADGASNSSSKVDHHHLDLHLVEGSTNDGIQTTNIHDDPSNLSFPGNIVPPPFYPLSVELDEAWQHVTNHTSTNPFDLPYDSELEPNNMFLDMSSLHESLPSIQPSPSIQAQPWFAADFETSYLPAPEMAQGGLPYVTGQAASPQLQNAAAQGPVASIGGNPFA